MNRRTRFLQHIRTISIALLVGYASPVLSAEGSIRIGVVNPLKTLDPHDDSAAVSMSVKTALYSQLVRENEALELVPELADRWEQVEPTRWRFYLNPRAVFDDGKRVDAGVVKWNFDRILDPNAKFTVKSSLTTVTAVEVVDENTVDILTKGPDLALLDTIQMVKFVDPEWFAGHNAVLEAFGSGPYRLESFTPSGDVVLKAKTDYWGRAASVDEITFKVFGSPAAIVNAVIAGEIEVASDVEPKDLTRIKAEPALKVIPVESYRTSMVKFNTELKPLDDVRVRQAINYAVDKQAIVEAVLLGTTAVSPGQVLTRYYRGYDPDLPAYPYDPEKARQLLAEAGFAEGLKLEADVPAGRYVEGERITQAIAGQLQQVGIELNISIIPPATFTERYLKTHSLSQLTYLAQAGTSTQAFLSYFESGTVYAYWDDKEYSDLVKEGRFATDTAQAETAFRKAVARMRDQAPIVFLFPQPKVYVTTSTVNWTPAANDVIVPQALALNP